MEKQKGKTICEVRKDILVPRDSYTSIYGKISAAKLIAIALGHLSLRTASFDMNPAKDEEIKGKIKLWIQSWVIPPLELAYDKAAKRDKRFRTDPRKVKGVNEK